MSSGTLREQAKKEHQDNLAICKRIAEIEGAVKVSTSQGRVDALFEYQIGGLISSYITHGYSPLLDDALCFQLMVKHQIKLMYTNCPAGSGTTYWTDGGCYCSTANKSICLAIIEANKNNESQ